MPLLTMANVKVAVFEVDGVEYGQPVERDLSGDDASFSGTLQDYTSTKVGPALREILFGKKYQYATSDTETSNTSTTTYVNKVTLTTPSLVSGTYRVSWTFQWRASAANRGIKYRIQVGGVEILAPIEFAASTASLPLCSGSRIVPAISGVKTITLDFLLGIGTGTVYMKNAVVEIWRIS